jgi:hypothetical protein
MLTEALPSAVHINRSVSREDIIEAVRKLPFNKAPRPGHIPNRIVKACLELLADHLAHLFTAGYKATIQLLLNSLSPWYSANQRKTTTSSQKHTDLSPFSTLSERS